MTSTTSPSKRPTETGPSQKKKKETGTSELPLNEIGTRELHDRHRIKIEDGDTFARARVTDQTFVDRLLPNWSSIPGNHRTDGYTNGLLRYSRTLRFVEQNLGYEAASILARVVVEDRGTEEKEELQVVISCLELLSGRR